MRGETLAVQAPWLDPIVSSLIDGTKPSGKGWDVIIEAKARGKIYRANQAWKMVELEYGGTFRGPLTKSGKPARRIGGGSAALGFVAMVDTLGKLGQAVLQTVIDSINQDMARLKIDPGRYDTWLKAREDLGMAAAIEASARAALARAPARIRAGVLTRARGGARAGAVRIHGVSRRTP